MSAPAPKTVTQYPGGEPAVYIAPDFQQVGADALINNSAAVASLNAQIATMQAQIADLTTRVTALENAATQAPPA
jgi:hypothetical protein